MSENFKRRRSSSLKLSSLPRRASLWDSTIFVKWSSKEGAEPGVRCNSLCRNGSLVTGTGYHLTIWETFKNGLAVSGHRNCLGWRINDECGFKWWTYEQFAQKVRALALALVWKTRLRRQDCVGIYAASQPNWLVVAYACASRSLIVVPLYATLGADSCVHIVNQTNMTVIFVDTPDAARRLIERAYQLPLLTTIVTLSPIALELDLCRSATRANISVFNLAEFLVLDLEPVGDEATVFDPPSENEICYVLYTSGTTGIPKGVMLSHRAVVSNAISVDHFVRAVERPGFRLSEADVCLLFLPLAHGYGLLIANWFLYRGASIGFYGGDVTKLMDDAALLKPTFVPLLPRLMNKIFAKTQRHLSKGGVKAKLFLYAFGKKKELLQRGVITRDSIWDQMVFRKLQNLIGGRAWLVSVGSAPVSGEIIEFWQIVFGCLVVEGYGQTECNAVASLAIGPHGGNVGHPVQCNYLKLVDAPEVGYVTRRGQGEVCVKGSNVMLGYFKQPDRTNEAIDDDGWLHTGDIGEFLPNGALRIIDRKKHIFKLAQGEYVSPEKVENVYSMCPLVSQVFVDGNSSEWYTIAIVVLEATAIEEYANERRLDAKSFMRNDCDLKTVEFTRFVLEAMRTVGRANQLNSIEQVRSIYVTSEAFTPANSLATPTLKNRRVELRRHFAEKIVALYRSGPLIDDAPSSSIIKTK